MNAEIVNLEAIRDTASRGVPLLPQDAVALLLCIDARDRRIRNLEEVLGEIRGACTAAQQVLAPHAYTEASPGGQTQ